MATPSGQSAALSCPKCRQTCGEIVTTGSKREGYCSNCSHVWPYAIAVCQCGVVPVPHLHKDDVPACPQCGKPAGMTKPA